MIQDYFWLAWRSIKNRQVRSWLTMIGIFIGVASVVALVSLGQGLSEAINKEFASFGVDKVIIQGKSSGFGPPGTLAAGKITEHDIDVIERVKGVEVAAGRSLQSAIIEFNDEQQTRGVVSLPKDPKAADLVLGTYNFKVASGRMLRSSDKGKVILGSNYVDGKLFTKPVTVGNKVTINGKVFEVVGILEKLGDPFADNAAVMPEEDMEALFQTNGTLSAIAAQIKKGEDLNKVSEDISKAMRRDRGLKEGKEDFQIQTPQQFLESINAIIGMVQAVVVGIAAISIIVGAIGIMNTMYTSVLERTKEIGIMKATGARNEHIMMLFLIESGMLGMAGGAIGIALGVGIGKAVEAVATQALGTNLLQAYFPWQLIVGALLFSFLLGALSGTLPAMQASKLQPVTALKHE